MKTSVDPQWTKSSGKCAIELVPVPRLRRVVIVSGWIFMQIGLFIIVQMPLAVPIKLILIAAWIADCLWGLKRQVAGNVKVKRIKIDTVGVVECLDQSGYSHKIQLLKGSVVLQRWAWLRLRFPDGQHYVELLSKIDCPATTWRRLQLLWRHAL